MKHHGLKIGQTAILQDRSGRFKRGFISEVHNSGICILVKGTSDSIMQRVIFNSETLVSKDGHLRIERGVAEEKDWTSCFIRVRRLIDNSKFLSIRIPTAKGWTSLDFSSSMEVGYVMAEISAINITEDPSNDKDKSEEQAVSELR